MITPYALAYVAVGYAIAYCACRLVWLRRAHTRLSDARARTVCLQHATWIMLAWPAWLVWFVARMAAQSITDYVTGDRS